MRDINFSHTAAPVKQLWCTVIFSIISNKEHVGGACIKRAHPQSCDSHVLINDNSLINFKRHETLTELHCKLWTSAVDQLRYISWSGNQSVYQFVCVHAKNQKAANWPVCPSVGFLLLTWASAPLTPRWCAASSLIETHKWQGHSHWPVCCAQFIITQVTRSLHVANMTCRNNAVTIKMKSNHRRSLVCKIHTNIYSLVSCSPSTK